VGLPKLLGDKIPENLEVGREGEVMLDSPSEEIGTDLDLLLPSREVGRISLCSSLSRITEILGLGKA
jgi:hypothetical protein